MGPRQRRLSILLLQSPSSVVVEIIAKELGDGILAAAYAPKRAVVDAPDIRIHTAQNIYTVEVCNEPFPILSVAADDPTFDRPATGVMAISTAKTRWLVRALRMRQDTLRRVAEAFLTFQPAVSEGNDDPFKRVSVRQVAECAQLHESTVERAVANKVVAISGRRIQFDSLVAAPS